MQVCSFNKLGYSLFERAHPIERQRQIHDEWYGDDGGSKQRHANISQIETYITTSQLHVRYWTIYVSNFCYRKNKFKFSFMDLMKKTNSSLQHSVHRHIWTTSVGINKIP